MADQILGTKQTSNVGGAWFIVGTTLNQNALTPIVATQSGFAKRLGMWARRNGANNPKPQLAIWDSDAAGGLPGTLLGYTATIGVAAGAASAGVNYEAAVAWSAWDATLGVTGAAIRLIAGHKYWIGLHNEAFGLQVGQAASEPLRTIYRITKGVGNPTTPFGAGTPDSSTSGASLYVVYEPATGPVVTLTAPPATTSSSAPAITGTVADAESIAPFYDRIGYYLIEVRNASTFAMIWQPAAFLASGAERATATINRPYTGPALAPGSYQVRALAQDDAGQAGAWTAWRDFLVTNQGVIDVSAATPTGKQESGTVTTWSALWTHPNALAANAVRVRIRSGESALRGGDDLTLNPFRTITSVADGATISIADSITQLTQGTNAPLPSGSYTWSMQAKDTAVPPGTTSWSADVPFNVNFAPNMPTALQPESGARSAVKPVLSWAVGDQDPDDVLGSTLVTDYEIIRLDTGAITASGQTANVDAPTGRGYLDIVANPTFMPAAVAFQWRVRGRDLSAVAAGTGLGDWSNPTIFNLVSTPVVTITSPLQGASVSTSAPQIAWTVSTEAGGQNFYLVEVFTTDEPNIPIWGSGIIPTSDNDSGLHSIPAGVLTNGVTYDVRVTIWAPGDIEGRSLKRRFTVSFTSATQVNNVTAGLFKTDYDFEAATVALGWDPSGYSALEFAGYLVTRRLDTEPASAAVVIAHIQQAGQTSYRDYHAPPNVGLIYGVSQLRRFTGDVRQSPVTEVEATVPLTTPVIASMLSGAELRAPVMMLSDEYAQGFRKPGTLLDVWGTEGKPLKVRAPRGHGHVPIAVGIFILSDERGDLHEHMARWTALVESGDPVSLRTETRRFICDIDSSEDWLHRTEWLGVMKVELSLTEIYWNEAVKVIT